MISQPTPNVALKDNSPAETISRLEWTVRDQNARLHDRKMRIRELEGKLRQEPQREIQQLTSIVDKLLKRHYHQMPLPPEELRLHVGTRTTAANFWAQGLSSSTRVCDIFGAEPAGPVLDWGCGCGRTLRWLLNSPAWREHYRGCDVDAAAIKWLRENTPCPLEVCGDHPPLPYPDATFTGLFAFSVLTHIPPKLHRAWYAEIRRVLRPGGKALLTVQGSDILKNPSNYSVPLDMVEAFGKSGQAYIHHEGHYKDAALVNEEFTRQQLEGLLTVESYKVGGYQNMDQFIVRRDD
ncbi:MAG: class I SAM-dependent methyltransferase [Pirellulales bacterium]|nr:class I SAM-dependent methyltransferase [Pirellulales bacterium]